MGSLTLRIIANLCYSREGIALVIKVRCLFAEGEEGGREGGWEGGRDGGRKGERSRERE